ncbi:MAG TPA: lysine 2,3-aminomutase, partial [Bacillus bacterium]|nr:lysine 2,3-aminomutase [Bacillus sp. (in: firmicutes)]
IPGRAEGYFKQVYPDYEKKKSNTGIAAIMNDSEFNLIPEGLRRLDRRGQYEVDPEHASLKDKREKRDELKEKKFLSQQKRTKEAVDGQGVIPTTKE